MDTTPIWPGDGPQQQQQQQSMLGLSESQPLVAALLPLDFQATYTDGFLAVDGDAAADVGGATSAAAAAAIRAAGGGVNGGGVDEDAVMALARQEGVLIDSDELQSLF